LDPLSRTLFGKNAVKFGNWVHCLTVVMENREPQHNATQRNTM
jgi:hypothetical protein